MSGIPPVPPTSTEPHIYTVVWVLTGALAFVLAITIPAIAYFLVREFNRKDQLEQKTDALNKTLNEVRGMVYDTKTMIAGLTDKFVTRPEFNSVIDELKQNISDIRATANNGLASIRKEMREEFESCRKDCPVRGTKISLREVPNGRS